MVSFTLRTLYLRGNERMNPPNRGFGAYLEVSEETHLPVQGFRTVWSVATPTETELHRLQNVKNTVWIDEDPSPPPNNWI